MRNALHRSWNAARGTSEAESEPDRGGPGADVNFRLIRAGLVAGVVAGLIAGGAGSRLAMRIVAVAAGSAHAGQITEAQAVVGKVTVGGTVFLLIAGAFVGLVGGVIYLLAWRWMPATGAARGLAFGFFLLAAAGHPIISGDNVDFTKFVSPYLAVGLFAALFPLYGLIVSPLTERIAGPVAMRKHPSVFGYAVLAAVAIFGLVRLANALSQIYVR